MSATCVGQFEQRVGDPRRSHRNLPLFTMGYVSNFAISASNDISIIIIIEAFVTRLLQLKNEHKRYICYGKIDKKRL